jgi:hypothetical protein
MATLTHAIQSHHAFTVFRDVVYISVQHAFFSCLVWGLSNEIQYRFYPNGNKVPPLMSIDNPIAVGVQTEGPLAVHLMVVEPSHTRLLELASHLRCAGYTHCMLLIGTLTPHKAGKETNGLRGLLLHVDRLVGADDGSGAYPSDTVEHGWKMCFDTKEGASLYFALNAQRSVGNSLEVMPIAELPVLANIGLRLWRRGDVAHAIVPKNTPNASSDWDEKIKRFLEIPVE